MGRRCNVPGVIERERERETCRAASASAAAAAALHASVSPRAAAAAAAASSPAARWRWRAACVSISSAWNSPHLRSVFKHVSCVGVGRGTQLSTVPSSVCGWVFRVDGGGGGQSHLLHHQLSLEIVRICL